MSYLYSKLPETGVPLLIGTGGQRDGFGGGSQLLPISSLACETTFR
jgi:hypothetical protein